MPRDAKMTTNTPSNSHSIAEWIKTLPYPANINPDLPAKTHKDE